ncbi:MAG: thioredoxin-dependent thiol peroxidase [Bacteroidota bacterium]|jgi:peroxiredoxin Q/BCP|nr:thioredoxin-dependent thiol peroxidase [Bacteroidota bacterium]
MQLKVGQKAPDFSSTAQNGDIIRLSDQQGKKIILYFYPKDNTPGCTAQACNLRDNFPQLTEKGYIIFGVSTDTAESHIKFIQKQQLPFVLIADTDRSIHELYGVWQEKSMYGKKYMGTVRTTFVINENGVIEDIIEKVNTKDHTSQIIKNS